MALLTPFAVDQQFHQEAPSVGAHANRSVPGLYHPTSESCRRFVAFLLALSDDGTKRAGEQTPLSRIGQGRYRALDLHTPKCLSCMGADTSGGATLLHRYLSATGSSQTAPRRRARLDLDQRLAEADLPNTSPDAVVRDDLRGLWPGRTFGECLGAFTRKANYPLV